MRQSLEAIFVIGSVWGTAQRVRTMSTLGRHNPNATPVRNGAGCEILPNGSRQEPAHSPALPLRDWHGTCSGASPDRRMVRRIGSARMGGTTWFGLATD